ncbi:MAG: glutamate--tRNA ligase [Rhodothermia bacterium]|nr:glutamate--tRNA ligase [Rhodothermia bacterium]
MSVRVRFAPSPTGYLHIGGLRTALYNYLFARRNGGSFVLRIEDTDQSRLVADAEDDIVSALQWSGLAYDEGPDIEGSFGPYRQSERSDLYREAATRLLKAGHAYYAFDTPEELEAMRDRLSTDGNPSPSYDMSTRSSMRNSLTLSAVEVDDMISSGAPHVVRLKVPPSETVTFTDAVRGNVTFDSSEIDDQVLIKSDGMPTYHLANVVDDHAMEITHVIRGEEWLPSTPKHVLLYQFLGWRAPEMAHLPLILSPTGGKLSKRKADKQGIMVLVRDYIDAGYEPEALVNYLAFLGWNPGTEQEVFNLHELEEVFSLNRVGQSGVQFSPDKLRWYNEQHLRSLDNGKILMRAKPHLKASGIQASDDYLLRVINLMRDRITFAADIASNRYFFEDPQSFDAKGLQKRWKSESPQLLRLYAEALEEPAFDAEAAEGALRSVAEQHGVGAGQIIHPVRLALSGVTFGPGLFELMELLGKETCLRRIRAAVESIPAPSPQ